MEKKKGALNVNDFLKKKKGALNVNDFLVSATMNEQDQKKIEECNEITRKSEILIEEIKQLTATRLLLTKSKRVSKYLLPCRLLCSVVSKKIIKVASKKIIKVEKKLKKREKRLCASRFALIKCKDDIDTVIRIGFEAKVRFECPLQEVKTLCSVAMNSGLHAFVTNEQFDSMKVPTEETQPERLVFDHWRNNHHYELKRISSSDLWYPTRDD